MKKLLILLPVLMFLLPQAALAGRGAGSLDPSFGHGGRVVVPLNVGFDSSSGTRAAIAKLPRGETVVLAGNSLVALRPDGRPARVFAGGRVEVPAPAGSSLRLVDVAADPQGRILVAGTLVSPVQEPLQWPYTLDEDAFLARFTPEGNLDPNFGQGGIVRTDLGASPVPIETGVGTVYSPARTSFEGVAVDPSGRIVLSGMKLSEIHSCRFTPNYPYEDAFASRLLTDGSFDQSFGQNGVVLVQDSAAVTPPALTRSGGTYLLDYFDPGCAPRPTRLTRLDVNGAAAQPVLTVDEEGLPTSIAIDSRGRVLLVSSENVHSAGLAMALVRRILPGGRLDPKFGKGGSVRVRAPRGLDFEPSAIRAGAGGKIVIAGTARPSGTPSDPRRFMVARLTDAGVIDRGFSGNGRALTRFGRPSRAVADDVTLVQGGIVAAGRLSRPSLPGGEGLALAQYLVR